MAGRLEGKVALIVGAGQTPGATIGNGRATALRFAQEGASLFLVDRRLKSAEETLAMVVESGGNGVAHEADVTSEAACAGMVEACSKLFGRIDILRCYREHAPSRGRAHFRKRHRGVAHEDRQQLLSGRRSPHVQRHTIERQGDTQTLRQAVEHFPVINDLRVRELDRLA